MFGKQVFIILILMCIALAEKNCYTMSGKCVHHCKPQDFLNNSFKTCCEMHYGKYPAINEPRRSIRQYG
ncbi:hypothetical protein FQR65_LT04323 [Abscondita terminalis]|nr:hypothetical protein FQR65_LT04323 [Abscondita terminalis]